MNMVEARNVNVTEAIALRDAGALLLDVREDNEWASGRIAESKHVPMNDVPDIWEELPSDRLVLCVCRSGARSGRVAKFLVERGLDAVNLEGGLLAWNVEGGILVGDIEVPTII